MNIEYRNRNQLNIQVRLGITLSDLKKKIINCL